MRSYLASRSRTKQRSTLSKSRNFTPRSTGTLGTLRSMGSGPDDELAYDAFYPSRDDLKLNSAFNATFTASSKEPGWVLKTSVRATPVSSPSINTVTVTASGKGRRQSQFATLGRSPQAPSYPGG
ncbi:unnamed protein product [Phytophthora fragariaefolia]|uniref:Unnamed protein product n=1 Tax=Phytophthora fragariaefolia TaxID=1490495 RepID=A0A9W6XTD8_9STRA|nr:unnamed protein product [Phytophthora fragariaefolia]